MLYQAKHYLKFLLKSTNQHGVHSPFVYDLVTKCLYDNREYFEYSNLTDYRNHLKHENHQIDITDFGAGSTKLKSKSRKVVDIVNHVSISKKNAKLLFRICNYFKPQHILELGTSLGLATQAMSLGNPNSKILTIEGCPEITKYTSKQFKQIQLKNVKPVNGEFSKIIPQLPNKKFDLIFFDGNHTKQATLDYYEKLLPKAHNDTLFIFDDIHWSKDMTEAWDIIKAHPRVTATIDTFQWGLIFFRQEQAKEHFKIRI